MTADDLTFRLRKRAEIRRQIATRKSVQEGAPDRISDLLEESATALDAYKAHAERLAGALREVLAYQRAVGLEDDTCSSTVAGTDVHVDWDEARAALAEWDEVSRG